MARNALHVRGLALYLGLIVAWVAVHALWLATPLHDVLFQTSRAALVASAPIALVFAYAWLAARGAAYTITNRRVVIRMGIAVPLTLNLPFAKIDSADLAMQPDGTGDLALRLAPGAKGLGWFIMWPHTRPWHFGQAQPMLRALADAPLAGQVLAAALAETGAAEAITPVSLAQPTRNVDTVECHHGATTVAA